MKNENQQHVYFLPGWAIGHKRYECYSKVISCSSFDIIDLGFFSQDNRKCAVLSPEVEHINSLLSERSQTSQVYLMGHSLGSLLAIETVLSSKKPIKALILFSPFARFTETTGYPGQSTRNVLTMQTQLNKYPYKVLEGFYKTMVYPSDLNIHVPQTINPKALQAGLDCLLTKDFRDKLNKIKIPTLIIHGEKDRIVNPDISQKLHMEINNSTLHIIKNAGHAIPLTHTEECISIIKDFVPEKTKV